MTAIAGSRYCLRCGGELIARPRPVSPFGMAAARSRMPRRVAAMLGVLAVAASLGPGIAGALGSTGAVPRIASPVALAVTGAPRAPEYARVQPQDVQESCVGRMLPGDLQPTHPPPAVIDGNPRTSWHCDGDGAHLRPPQSLAVFFARPVTLAAVGVIGYDQLRPCRFVTSMGLSIGAASYHIPLPARPYRSLRWFAVPPTRTGRLTLAVLRTTVPPGSHGPSCFRTAVAEVGFASRREAAAAHP